MFQLVTVHGLLREATCVLAYPSRGESHRSQPLHRHSQHGKCIVPYLHIGQCWYAVQSNGFHSHWYCWLHVPVLSCPSFPSWQLVQGCQRTNISGELRNPSKSPHWQPTLVFQLLQALKKRRRTEIKLMIITNGQRRACSQATIINTLLNGFLADFQLLDWILHAVHFYLSPCWLLMNIVSYHVNIGEGNGGWCFQALNVTFICVCVSNKLSTWGALYVVRLMAIYSLNLHTSVPCTVRAAGLLVSMPCWFSTVQRYCPESLVVTLKIVKVCTAMPWAQPDQTWTRLPLTERRALSLTHFMAIPLLLAATWQVKLTAPPLRTELSFDATTMEGSDKEGHQTFNMMMTAGRYHEVQVFGLACTYCTWLMGAESYSVILEFGILIWII